MEPKTKPKRQRNVLFVQTPDRLKQRLVCAAEVLEQDLSTFTRDALTRHLDRLAAENKAVARALRAVA